MRCREFTSATKGWEFATKHCKYGMDSCKSDPTIPQWSNFGTATPFVLQLEAGKTACVSGTPWYQHISAEWLTNIHHWVVHDEIGLHPWPGRQARLAASQTLSAGAGECRFSPLNNCHLGANYTHLIYIYDIYIYILHMIDTFFSLYGIQWDIMWKLHQQK